MTKSLSEFHQKLGIRRRGQVVPRDAYMDYMTFRRNIRPMFTEIFGPLVGLKEEWAQQGASAEEIDMSAFGFRYADDGGVPVNTGFAHGFPEQILEETQDNVVARDHMGRTVKLAKQASTLAIPLDWPIRNFDDWKAFRHHYEFSEDRFGAGWEQAARDHLAAGRVVTVSIPGGFDECRNLMGEEALCMAYYDQPKLIEDMLETMGQTAYRVLDRVSSRVQIDQLFIHEDLAGRSGSLVGPVQIRQFIQPYYHRIWDMLASRGARLFKQDSDGNVNSVIPAFLDAGLNFMYPMEPAAGMDIVQVRASFPKLAVMGGIDKFVLTKGQAAIRAELEYKIPPLVASGAAVFGLDHRIPNGTPLEAYRFYHRTAWDILNREADKLGLED